MSKLSDQDYLERAKRVLTIEAEAIKALTSEIDGNYLEVCRLLHNCRGRVVVTGMGKSGHIGSKIAATLASTGTPAFFMHPAEASHGDLGMITKDDLLLALSYSGETDEILAFLPLIGRLNIPLVAITGNQESSLAQFATKHLLVAIKEEACPLGLAPTASTTATLAMGDAIAITLLEMKGFTSDDFAFSHPGGKLGRRLLLLVEDIMVPRDEAAILSPDATLYEALLEMTRFPLGIILLADEQHQLLGVFTEGDLRRTLVSGRELKELTIGECMTTNPHTIGPKALAVDAVNQLEREKITALPVVDGEGRIVGALNMHHLLNARVI